MGVEGGETVDRTTPMLPHYAGVAGAAGSVAAGREGGGGMATGTGPVAAMSPPPRLAAIRASGALTGTGYESNLHNHTKA